MPDDQTQTSIEQGEGYAAWGNGTEHDECPYPTGQKRSDWQAGWREAEQWMRFRMAGEWRE